MESADVLIVGGGLVGCATAWRLARAGVSVLVLERGELNSGASGQNAGSLHFQIERRFLEHGEAVADQAARVIALSRLAVVEWASLQDELGEDLQIHMTGGLMIAETPDQVGLLERKARRESDWDLPTRLIDGEQARCMAPYLSDQVLAASYMAEEGHANPRILTNAFARAAAALGARFATHTRLTVLKRIHGGFGAVAERPDGDCTFRADKVLVAAGAWTATVGVMLNLHLPVSPAGLTMNVTERTAPFMHHLIQHVGKRLSMKQAEAGNILIGGGWPSRLARGPDGFDLSRPPELIPQSVRENLRVAVETVPSVAGLNLIRSWTGVVAQTADQLPIVGETPGIPGLFVVAGGSGFTLGPTFARLLAQQILTGRKDAEELSIFAPARFEHLNSFMG